MKIEMETLGPGDEAWSIIEIKRVEIDPATGNGVDKISHGIVTGKLKAVVVYVANQTDAPIVEHLYERADPNQRYVRAYNAYATEAEALTALEEVNKEGAADDKGKD